MTDAIAPVCLRGKVRGVAGATGSFRRFQPRLPGS
jgi:hypothetical protein